MFIPCKCLPKVLRWNWIEASGVVCGFDRESIFMSTRDLWKQLKKTIQLVFIRNWLRKRKSGAGIEKPKSSWDIESLLSIRDYHLGWSQQHTSRLGNLSVICLTSCCHQMEFSSWWHLPWSCSRGGPEAPFPSPPPKLSGGVGVGPWGLCLWGRMPFLVLRNHEPMPLPCESDTPGFCLLW